MMWLNWQKWTKISSAFKMKLTTILNINLHRYNEHVRSVWSCLVDNLYDRLSEIFLTQALSIWSREIFLKSTQMNCTQMLKLAECFQRWTQGFTVKPAVYLEFSKAFAVLPPVLRSRWQIHPQAVQYSHLSVNSAPDHAGLIQGSSDPALQKDRLTCPAQSFPVRLENWEAYSFSLGFGKLWPTKNDQHAGFNECHFLSHCCLGNIFPMGRQQLSGNLYQGWLELRGRQEDLSSYFSFQGSPTVRMQWFFLVEWIIVAGRTKNTFKCPSFEGKTLFTFKWAGIQVKSWKWRI